MVFGLFKKQKSWHRLPDGDFLEPLFSFYDNGDYRVGKYDIDQDTSFSNVTFAGMFRIDKESGEGEVLTITPLKDGDTIYVKYECGYWWVYL